MQCIHMYGLAYTEEVQMLLAYVVAQSDIRDKRCRTELDIWTSDVGQKVAESDTMSDIRRHIFPRFDNPTF